MVQYKRAGRTSAPHNFRLFLDDVLFPLLTEVMQARKIEPPEEE